MSLRNALKATLVGAVLAISQQSYAQESREEPRKQRQEVQTITVNRKKYYITPDKIILDEKGKRQGQDIQRDVMFTYIINKSFQNYEQTAQNNLKNFNRTRTITQFVEIFKGYSTVLKAPFKTIIESLRDNPGSLITKLILVKGLYKGIEQALSELYLDERMYSFIDLTAHLLEAEPKYKKFISLLKQGLTEHQRAKEAFDLVLESEHIILAVPETFKTLRKKRKRINKQEEEIFYTALKDSDTNILQKICRNVQSRARKSPEHKKYIKKLIKEKGNSLAFKLQQNIRRQGLRKIFNSIQ